eukprot:1151461-Pelagomonas_calceolata.AAC.1
MNLLVTQARSGHHVVQASSATQPARLTPRQKRLRAQQQLYKQQQKQQQQQQQQQQPKHLPGRGQLQQPQLMKTLYPPSVADAPQNTEFVWSVWEQPKELSNLDAPQSVQLATHWAEEACKKRQHPRNRGFASLSDKERDNAVSNLTSLLASAASTQLSPLAPGSIQHVVAWAAAHFQDLCNLELRSQLHALEQTMDLPFRVLPLVMPHLELRDLMNEVKLSRHQIFLDGGTKAVPESRLTVKPMQIAPLVHRAGRACSERGRK